MKWFHRKASLMYLALDEIAGVVEFPTSFLKQGLILFRSGKRLNGNSFCCWKVGGIFSVYMDVPWCCDCVVADLVVLHGVLPVSVLLSVFESLAHTSLFFSGGFFLKAISGGSGNIITVFCGEDQSVGCVFYWFVF